MAWLEKRTRGGTIRYRVVWREDGIRQQQSFDAADTAADFLGHVRAEHDHWPRNWIKGVGWAYEQADESTAPTFDTYAARTIAVRGRADERTKADYLRMLEHHVSPVIGHLAVDRITRFDVADVAKAMRLAGKAPKTIENVHAVLSSVLDDAAKDDLIRRNPARGALPTLPDSRDEDMTFLTRSEFAQIRTAIVSISDYGPDSDLAVFLAGTGMRWGEATALQVHDVDLLGRRTVKVRRAWKRRGGLFVLGDPKTRRSRRTLSLSPELVDLLVPYVSGKDPAEFVFTTVRGHAIRHSNWYNRIWCPSVLRAGQCDTHAEAKGKPCGCPGTLTKRPTPHSLRHTHASWLIDEKVSIVAIQRRLGHESIQTTIDRYGHLVPEHSDEIDAAVDKALKGDAGSTDRTPQSTHSSPHGPGD